MLSPVNSCADVEAQCSCRRDSEAQKDPWPDQREVVLEHSWPATRFPPPSRHPSMTARAIGLLKPDRVLRRRLTGPCTRETAALPNGPNPQWRKMER